MFFLEYDNRGLPSGFHNTVDGPVPSENVIPLRNEQYFKVLANPNLFKVIDGKLVERPLVVAEEKKTLPPNIEIDGIVFLLSDKYLQITSLDILSGSENIRMATIVEDKLHWVSQPAEDAKITLSLIADEQAKRLGDSL